MKKFLLFISLLVFVLGCNLDKYADIGKVDLNDFDGELAFPIFSTTFSLTSLLEKLDDNSSLEILPDNLLKLKYTGKLHEISSETLLPKFNGLFPVVFEDNNPIQEFLVDIDESFIMETAEIKTGEVTIPVLSFDVEEDVELIFVFENILDGGAAVQTSFTVKYDGTTPFQSPVHVFDLAGYKMVPDDNFITMKYFATTTSGAAVNLGPFIMFFNKMSYGVVTGNFGEDVYEIGQDSIVLDLFENWSDGNIEFEDPKLTLFIENSMGIPLLAVFEELSIIDINGDKMDFESIHIDNGIDLGSPSIENKDSVIYTSFQFNKDNSNLKEILAAGPQVIVYKINGEPKVASGQLVPGFFTDNSIMNVTLEAELTSQAKLENYAIKDTFDFSIKEDINNISALEFKLNTLNQLPTDIGVQLSFLNSENEVLSTLFDESELLTIAASVDQFGNVNESSKFTKFIEIPHSKIQDILSAEKIYMEAFISTPKAVESTVRILANQEVKINLGCKLTLNQ